MKQQKQTKIKNILSEIVQSPGAGTSAGTAATSRRATNRKSFV